VNVERDLVVATAQVGEMTRLQHDTTELHLTGHRHCAVLERWHQRHGGAARSKVDIYTDELGVASCRRCCIGKVAYQNRARRMVDGD
jgi:hypothetical protein